MSNQKWRNSSEYHHWRKAVIERDKCCKVCSSTDKLNAHHLRDASYHPDIRFDVDNGVTLCHQCHHIFHILYKGSYRKKTYIVDFKRFKAIAKYYRRQGMKMRD